MTRTARCELRRGFATKPADTRRLGRAITAFEKRRCSKIAYRVVGLGPPHKLGNIACTRFAAKIAGFSCRIDNVVHDVSWAAHIPATPETQVIDWREMQKGALLCQGK